MSLRLLFLTALSLSVTGCATVDIADVASGGQVQTVEVASEKNVVIKATDALDQNFKNKGWVQAPAVERFRSAANVLLRGKKKEDAHTDSVYVASNSKHVTLIALRQHILEAGKDVAKTVKAAEIYLDMSEVQADLKPELKALETAYMSSRRAEDWFEKSLKKIDGADVETELSAFAASVDRLRESTNQYGQRVRERSRALKVPTS